MRGYLGMKVGPGKHMDCLCYVVGTILTARTSEAADILELFATSLGNFGLELDVPEAGTEIDPNQPGAKMTACC